ncbi:MAG: methyl-accepting chemotaxis protein [Melioribacteraceae bacterium]
MGTIKNLSISKKISLTVIGILVFTLSIYLVIFFLKNDYKVYERIEYENKQISSLLTESIRLAMASGADDTEPFVNNLSKYETIKDVRIIPTEIIAGPNNDSFDEHELDALKNKIEKNFYEEFNNSKVLRSISLLKSDKTCSDCHEAEEGEILAVVSIRQSLDKTYSEMASQKIDAFWIGLVAAILTFVFVSFFLKKILGNPIQKLSLAATDFAEGKFESSIICNSNDELGVLAKSLNEMAEKIDIQVQYLNKLPTPVSVMDRDFNITYINKKGAELLDKSQEEILGTKCYNNFKTKDCNTEFCACKTAIKEDKSISKETSAKPNNVDIPIFYSGSPIRNKSGQLIGVLEVITDLTESKEKEKYLERNTKIILEEMSKLANGDLRVKLFPEKDNDMIAELFYGFNNTVNNIKGMIEKVGETIQMTASASIQINSSTEQMAVGSQEQSTQAEEVSSAIEEMTRTIFDTSKNISSVAESSKNAGIIAREGNEVVAKTIIGMNQIAEVVTEAAKTVEKLGKSSEKIGAIIKVINEIADQTNLLALNAAIEAARAGEHGRGFAVVADEVKKLAERTTTATTEISGMIKEIQDDTKRAVSSIYSGRTEVEKGKLLTNKAGESLEKINKATNLLADLISQIATASEEQSATSEQISKSVEGISRVTRESSDGIEQIAKTAEELNILTDNLQSLIGGFKLNDAENKSNHLTRTDKKKLKELYV